MAEDIQRDPTQVELVRNRGQVLFCWTDDQNNPEIVKYLKNLGVDGGKEAALARAVLLRCSPTEVVTVIIINHRHYCHHRRHHHQLHQQQKLSSYAARQMQPFLHHLQLFCQYWQHSFRSK